MAASPAKQLRQMRMLGSLVLVIFGAMGYLYRDKILPAPQVGTEFSAQKRTVNVPKSLPESLYERPDFEALRAYGDVPVRPLPAEPSDPFQPLPAEIQ